MIVEIEDETRDFVTIYEKDYPPKQAKRLQECRPIPEYPPPLNVLNGAYKKCLNTRRQNALLPLNEQSEDPQEALNKIREKYPRLQKFLPEVVPDEELIERKENEIQQTMYQIDYSKGEFSPRKKIYGRESLILPDYWQLTETIQKKSYRNPWKIATEDFVRVKRMSKPPDNLKPDPREREALRIKTGYTEYNDTIDVTGNQIIKGRLFGEPLPIDPEIYTKRPDSPASECSQILRKEKVSLPSNVF